MPLPGGASAKAGLRYELLWTVRCLIRLMKGEFDSIWLEPAGEEGEGVEFAITASDGTEYHQVKRQLTGKGVWSLSELSRRGVLSHFYNKLNDSSATCWFVSSDSTDSLNELATRARDAGTWAEFQRNFVSSDKWDDNFNELHTRWKSPSTEDTYQRLTRVEVTTIDEASLREWVEDALEALVTGNPSTASDVLSSFALNRTHEELASQDVWAHLRSRGINRLVLRQSDETIGAISELNEKYLAGIKPVGIGGKVIPRDEVSQILSIFDDDQCGNIALVTGKTGVGKSSLIAQALEEIEERGWPILALRVDRIEPAATPRELGQRLGLPASPASALANLADGKDCLLIIDQLDAVSLASGRNPEFFDCIAAMLNQANHHPNMRVLVACRKFDVDNDHRIRELISANGIAQEVQLSEFDEATVREVVAKLGIESTRLNPKQIELLSLPVHLRLLAEVSDGKNGAPLGFQTAKELYDAFWEEKRRVLREQVDAAPVQEVADMMAKSMSARQALSVPASLLDEHHEIVDLMASENILVKDGARVSFFHESFFDYIFARRMVEDNFDAVQFILGQGQSLFIRSQIRQILLHQRDVYPDDALRNMEAILQHPDIRIHLKGIVLALLGSMDDPTADEWGVLESMLDTELSDHTWRAINGSPAWLDALDSIGVVQQWLASDDEQLLNRAIWFIRSVQDKRADKVAELLSPFINASDSWNHRLTGLISYSNLTADRSFFEFALKAINSGVMDTLLGPDNDGFRTWYQAEKVALINPEWACELIATYSERMIVLMKQSGEENPFASATQKAGDNVMSKVANAAPKKFAELLLPFLFDVIERNIDRIDGPPWRDSVWSIGVFGLKGGIANSFLLGMESALRWVAINEPQTFSSYEGELRKSNYFTIQNLLLRAYEADGKRYADEAIEYLLEDATARFAVGHISISSDCAVRQLIAAATPHCSSENLSRLEQAILNYYPEYEQGSDRRKWRGSTQLGLLECVENSRLSDNGRRRLQEMRRKFGKVALLTPGSITGGMVGSPIPAAAIRKMSNDNLLNAMASYSSNKFSDEPRDWLKGGSLQLSRELEAQVKENPTRFASLIHNMPDDANAHYFEAILRGIADSGLGMDATVAACLRCHSVPGRPFGRYITQPLTQFQEEMLPDDALELIAWYATENADPDPINVSSTRTYRVGGQQQLRYEPLTAGINSVRGTAVLTVANLIFQDEHYLSFFKPYLRTIVNDHSDAVRACAAQALLGTLRYDRDLAVALFLDLCNTDERLLGTPYLERFLYYAASTHFKELEHILTRMIESDYEEVTTAGARLICVASLSIEDALPLARRCFSGSFPMRMAAAEVYETNIRVSACRAECEKILGTLFLDEDKAVRDQASRCFIGFEGSELRDYSGLVRAYIQSPAFEPGYNPLIHTLRETTANVPSETLLACERWFDLVGASAGDISARESADSSDVMRIIIREYSKTTDDKVRSRCMDLIDKAILLGAYGVDSVEAEFDR